MNQESTTRISFIERPELMSENLIKKISGLGYLRIYNDRPSKKDLVDRLNACDIAVVEAVPISKEVLRRVHTVKHIIVSNTGFEFVDVRAAKKKGITVINIPDYATPAVSEYIFTVFLNVARGIWGRSLNGGALVGRPILSFELKSKTLGILGLGSIGSSVARIGKAFGMKIFFYDGENSIYHKKQTPPEILFQESDFLAICIPSNSSNNAFISSRLLYLMKKNAICVSISNNSVFDLEALMSVISKRKILYLSLEEPVDGLIELDSLLRVNNFEAWKTSESVSRNLKSLLKAIKACMKE